MAKTYSVSITPDELEQYTNSVGDKTKEISFIKTYIRAHTVDNVTTESDVYSLLLMEAMREEKTKVIERILGASQNQNIFINTNSDGFSAISILLAVGNAEAFILVEKHEKKNKGTIEKGNISQEQQKSFYIGMAQNEFEGLYYDDILSFLGKFYLDDDIMELKNLVEMPKEEALGLLGISTDIDLDL